MAQTPRGGSRSGSGGTIGESLQALAANQFSPFQALPSRLPRSSPQAPARYFGPGIDPRCVYVDWRNPPLSPAQLAQLRRDVDRSLFLNSNPMAAISYGVASAANAPPRVRDGALAVGSVFDAAMLGAAPRGAAFRTAPGPVPQHRVTQNLQMPAARAREVNAQGQARGVNWTTSAATLGTGTKANRRIAPPGWQGHGTRHNEARMHLQPKSQGGSGDDARNLTTGTQNPTNSSHMTTFDNRVTRAARAGGIIESSATPLYSPHALAPVYILQTALGLPGGPIAQLVRNPAGWRR